MSKKRIIRENSNIDIQELISQLTYLSNNCRMKHISYKALREYVKFSMYKADRPNHEEFFNLYKDRIKKWIGKK